MVSGLKGYKKYPLVEITWLDHHGDAGWSDEHDTEDDNPVECRTVGWLVKTGKVHLFVYDSLTNDGGRGGVSKILKKCVTNKKVLREIF